MPGEVRFRGRDLLLESQLGRVWLIQRWVHNIIYSSKPNKHYYFSQQYCFRAQIIFAEVNLHYDQLIQRTRLYISLILWRRRYQPGKKNKRNDNGAAARRLNMFQAGGLKQNARFVQEILVLKEKLGNRYWLEYSAPAARKLGSWSSRAGNTSAIGNATSL